MHKRTLIKNATIVNEGRSFVGSLLIENHHIEEILEGEDKEPVIPSDEVVNAKGCFLLPGIIDDHVHFRDPGLTHKADMRSESRAAAAGGVTTILDMPNTLPQTTTQEAFDEKMAIAAKQCMVNYGLFFGATNNNADALRKLNGRKVCGIKLFMGSSTGNMLVDNEHALSNIFENAKLPIMVHCEDTNIILRNMQEYRQRYGDDPTVKYHAEIRSEEACYQSTALAVRLAEQYHTRLHVAHVSTAKELELFEANHPTITAEACLPHLIFTDKDYDKLGTRIKCNPSIKKESDRKALWEALSNGKISVVATDHAPHLLSEKVGGALKAVSGMPMVQFSLLSMLGLVDKGILTPEKLVELMCHAPARIFQIENRGYLREGYKADLVLVRPNSPWTLTPNRIESKCNWSPLEGRTFRWRVEQTYCNGFLLYNKGVITDDNHHGQAITYTR